MDIFGLRITVTFAPFIYRGWHCSYSTEYVNTWQAVAPDKLVTIYTQSRADLKRRVRQRENNVERPERFTPKPEFRMFMETK